MDRKAKRLNEIFGESSIRQKYKIMHERVNNKSVTVPEKKHHLEIVPETTG